MDKVDALYYKILKKYPHLMRIKLSPEVELRKIIKRCKMFSKDEKNKIDYMKLSLLDQTEINKIFNFLYKPIPKRIIKNKENKENKERIAVTESVTETVTVTDKQKQIENILKKRQKAKKGDVNVKKNDN